MLDRVTNLLLSALSFLIFCSPVQAEILGDYMGYEACLPCHDNIVKGWKTTPHAHAFDTLKQQGEEKQSAPGCIKCHVVGYEEDGGFVDMALTPELKDVQCEVCHGPGRKHVENDGDPEFLTISPDESSCRTCHTKGQDKNFDFKTKSQWVHASFDHAEKLTKPESDKNSGFSLSETRMAFGNMTEGDVVQKTVILTNTGRENIRIINVTTS